MRISLHQQGGFLDIDRRIEVDDSGVKVVVSGVEQPPRPLDSPSRTRLAELVTKVCALQGGPTPAPSLASDDMSTQLEVDDGVRTRTLALSSGAAAPQEVWELVAAVDEVGGH